MYDFTFHSNITGVVNSEQYARITQTPSFSYSMHTGIHAHMYKVRVAGSGGGTEKENASGEREREREGERARGYRANRSILKRWEGKTPRSVVLPKGINFVFPVLVFSKFSSPRGNTFVASLGPKGNEGRKKKKREERGERGR